MKLKLWRTEWNSAAGAFMHQEVWSTVFSTPGRLGQRVTKQKRWEKRSELNKQELYYLIWLNNLVWADAVAWHKPWFDCDRYDLDPTPPPGPPTVSVLWTIPCRVERSWRALTAIGRNRLAAAGGNKHNTCIAKFEQRNDTTWITVGGWLKQRHHVHILLHCHGINMYHEFSNRLVVQHPILCSTTIAHHHDPSQRLLPTGHHGRFSPRTSYIGFVA